MRLRLESLERASMFRTLAMGGTSMSPEHLFEWGELVSAARAEWSGAAALSKSAPPARGSSAAYRVEEELEELSIRISEDHRAWLQRYQAALEECESQLADIRQRPHTDPARADLSAALRRRLDGLRGIGRHRTEEQKNHEGTSRTQ